MSAFCDSDWCLKGLARHAHCSTLHDIVDFNSFAIMADHVYPPRGVTRGGGRGARAPRIWQIYKPYSNQEGRLCPSHYCQPPRIQKSSYTSVDLGEKNPWDGTVWYTVFKKVRVRSATAKELACAHVCVRTLIWTCEVRACDAKNRRNSHLEK